LEGKWGRGLGRTVGDGKQIGVGLGPAHQAPLRAISGYAPDNRICSLRNSGKENLLDKVDNTRETAEMRYMYLQFHCRTEH